MRLLTSYQVSVPFWTEQKAHARSFVIFTAHKRSYGKVMFQRFLSVQGRVLSLAGVPSLPGRMSSLAGVLSLVGGFHEGEFCEGGSVKGGAMMEPPPTPRTINRQAVFILLECILVMYCF